MCKGGDLWLEQSEGEHARQVDNGKTLRGIILPAQRNPVLFNPKKWHGTTPWSGARVSISCFTTAKAGALDGSHQQQLQQLGFPVVVQASLSSPKPSVKGLKFTQGSDATDATTEVQGSQGSHEGQGSQDVSQLRNGFQDLAAEVDGAAVLLLGSELGNNDFLNDEATAASGDPFKFGRFWRRA